VSESETTEPLLSRTGVDVRSETQILLEQEAPFQNT
jgi:hypothetical protein